MADLVIMASGSGSNFEAIVQALAPTRHRVLALVTDSREAYAVDRSERLGVPWIAVPYADRRSAERRLLGVLDELAPALVALAGFMRILPPTIVDRFAQRIINVHPSLLPRFPGLRAIERSFASGDHEMGITIHYVDSGVDTGPIIEQHSFRTSEASSLEEAERIIHALEHLHYPRVLCDALDRCERSEGIL